MARYAHLPIYKASYDLLIKLMYLIKSYPKEYKYTLGEKIQNHILDLVVDIYKANSSIDKTKDIKSIQEHIQFLGLFLRISLDIQIINDVKYSELVELICSLDKQAASWLRSQIEGQASTGGEKCTAKVN